MKTSTKRLLAVAALLGATLCASPTDARKAGGQTARKSWRMAEAPTSVDMDTKDGKIVAMTAVKKDGSRLTLKPKSKPTCATSCPAGQKLECWEDEVELMTMCVCHSSGGGGEKGWIEINSH